MIDFLKLIRWPYLVCIALAQVAIYFGVVTPVVNVAGLAACRVFPSSLFVLLTVASVLVAAGGYAINDYFDVKIDEINHPLNHLVGRSIPKMVAMRTFVVCSVLGSLSGLAIGIYAWVDLEVPFRYACTYMMLFAIVAGILWFYSSSYKRMLVLGNLFASVLYALVPIFVAVFFNFFLTVAYGSDPEIVDFSHYLWKIILCFAFCVFMWTFVAEVADDFEEEKGDRELECHSFPIVLGHGPARAIMFAAILFFNAAIAHVIFRMLPFDPKVSLYYYVCAILSPSIGVAFLLAKAESRKDYKNVSLMARIIMLACIAYCVVFYFSYGE